MSASAMHGDHNNIICRISAYKANDECKYW